jgi:hypothetical protein
MRTKERFLNLHLLDGVLLALAMAWTITIATALFHPGGANPASSDLRAATTAQVGKL